VDNHLINSVPTHQAEQALKRRAVQCRARGPFVVETLIYGDPAEDALGLDVRAANVVLNLATREGIVGADGLTGIDRTSNRLSADQR